MANKQLFIFIILAVLLGTTYFVMDSSETQRESPRQFHLFDGVDGEAIAKVRIEQGSETLELARKDGSWIIPTRGGFPADATKIRALLLKIFDLSVSQKVPVSTGPDSDLQYEKLGVAESSVSKGQGKISFFDDKGSPISALRLGVPLQAKKANVFNSGGQYIRREGQPEVYAAALSLDVSPKVSSWLMGDLLTVLQNAIYDIELAKLSGAAATKEFSLGHTDLSEVLSGTPKDIEFQGTVPPEKQLDATGVSQVAGALENLRALDVWPADSPDVKDLVFDMQAKYRTISGLIYVVRSANKGDQTYLKISVEFDRGVIEAVQKEFAVMAEKLKAKAQATPTPGILQASSSPEATPAVPPSAEASPAATETPLGTPTPTPTPTPPAPEPPKQATKEEAEKLNAKFSSWVYQIPQYQGAALRKTLDTIVTAKPTATPNSAAAAPPPGLPEGISG